MLNSGRDALLVERVFPNAAPECECEHEHRLAERAQIKKSADMSSNKDANNELLITPNVEDISRET